MNDSKSFSLQNLSFNDLILVVSQLREDVAFLKNQVVQKSEEPQWMTLKELIEFLPSHPSPHTVYKWTSQGIIPYTRRGGALLFDRQEIETWLSEGRRKDNLAIQRETEQFINRKTRKNV